MKKIVCLTLVMLFVVILGACAKATPQAVEGMLKPGDKIGNMTVEIDTINSSYPVIWDFCEYQPEETEPAIQTIDCNVPLASGVNINFGWNAKAAMLASNWDAMAWELYIDGSKIDLEGFGWHEVDAPEIGANIKGRVWFVDLTNPSVGKHTIRYLWKSKISIDDGSAVYSPGTYEHVVNFTVIKN